ncbi:hypothetical protein [Streptomyces sp. SID13031]|uniref:hypothetical protein n=1 Tax=Streptomyces sp. SID13031 TaxID=2706046 RepID=UPI0013C7F3C8|nr:hypothetical protein [Streptomyces sp. SID13031]NEA32662.1 hypothetical protein [Streptomyces sp. SID13031]
MTPLKQHVLRVAAGLVGTVLAFSLAGTASAAPAPGPDLSAAKTAAHSTEATQLLAKAAQRTGSSAKSAAGAKLAVYQDTIPVYALSADFVRTGAGDVGTLWYVATPAAKGNTLLTVFTAPDQAGAWHPVNVATGNTEATMAAAASGAKLLTEPQLGAWYAVTGSTLRALNPEATKAIGSAPISLTAYKQQVSNRYADKQAGSTYAKNGTAGGYDVTASASTGNSPGAWLILAAGAAAAIALGVVTLITRRRRTA